MTIIEAIVLLVVVSIIAGIVLPAIPFSVFWFAITIAATLVLCGMVSVFQRKRLGATVFFVLGALIVLVNAPSIWMMRPLSYTLVEQEYDNVTLAEILMDQAKRQNVGLPYDFRMMDAALQIRDCLSQSKKARIFVSC